jgi:hypothetical protein
MAEILDGIIIGGVGGAIAGLTVSSVLYAHGKAVEEIHKRRIYNWLKANTSDEDGKKFRSTRAIASWNNLTEDRVRYICSLHDRIFLSTGQQEDMWSLYERGDRSVYEKRGIISV